MKWTTRFQFGEPVLLFCDPDGRRGRKRERGDGGEKEIKKEAFHLKNVCRLQTQEGPQRTTEWDETTKSPIISLVNRSVYLSLLSPSALLFFSMSSSLNQPLIVSLPEPVVLIRGLAQTSSLSTALLTRLHTRAQTLNKHILMRHQSCHRLNEPSSPLPLVAHNPNITHRMPVSPVHQPTNTLPV